MKLDRVRITNFRSIKEQTVTFDPRCRVLVGINESGKTNVLKALSMLSPGINPSREDVREALPDENPVDESYVRFIFTLNDEEIKGIQTNTTQLILTTAKAPALFQYKGKDLDVLGFCKLKNEGVFRVNVKTAAKEASYFKLSDEFEIRSRWKKKSKQYNPNQIIPAPNGTNLDLKNYSLIDSESYPDIPKELLEDVTADEVNQIIGTEIKKIVESKLPECTYWTYDEKNLLPAKIPLVKFTQNPDSCVPLKHMFELAGIDNIQNVIADVQKTSTGLRNLLNRVAIRSTDHIHAVWKEYKDVEIKLEPNGPDIDASIKDRHNQYEMSRRSDGFKRFASFLLMISTQVRTKQLENTLLLIDEPDNGLHPKGARYLRDELIRISNDNYVLYSTHSPFMIDEDVIKRHYITEKKNEETILSKADVSNIVDEEVLLNALGTSAFAILKKNNLLFEGWRDKELFEIALSRVPAQYKDLKVAFKEIGVCHAKGAKDLRYVGPLLELSNRGCFIVSDDDDVAKERQQEYIESRGYGTWKRYSQIMPGVEAITAEDFITLDAFQEAYKAVRKKYPSLPEISNADLVSIKGRLYALRSTLERNGVSGADVKGILEDLKRTIFDALKSTYIEAKYYEMIKKLSDCLAQSDNAERT